MTDGSVSSEPLHEKKMTQYPALSLTKNILSTIHQSPVWKRVMHVATNEKKTLRMIRKAISNAFRSAPKFKIGKKNPWNYREAI